MIRTSRPPASFPDSPCLGSTHLFYPNDEAGVASRTAKARDMCKRCPNREACLAWALEHDERLGMWGGVNERDRAKMHREYKRRMREAA